MKKHDNADKKTGSGMPEMSGTNQAAGQKSQGKEKAKQLPTKDLGFFERIIWWAIAGFCLFWIFFPEPTDVFPIIGWLDEVTALIVMVTALSRLGINIPFLEKLAFGGRAIGGKDANHNDANARGAGAPQASSGSTPGSVSEKDVTPRD